MASEFYIETDNAFHSVITKALQCEAVALDTEFFWERTYYPRLGLIQLALSSEECYLIDPLAITTLQPLSALLTNNTIVKIFHDAPQDLAILARATNSVPQNIFDTRLAAGFAEFPATLSLANLIEKLLDIKIDKSYTRSNWLQRPLTSRQILYAKDDVRYLRAIRLLLLSRIIIPEVKSWLAEELEIYDNPITYNIFNTTNRYRKIRGQQHLDGEGLSLLEKLSAWREETAQRQNRPRGHIIQDAVLLEIAQKRPMKLEELKRNTAISANAAKKYGAVLLGKIQQTRGKKEKKRKEPKNKKLTTREMALFNTLHKYILLKSDILGLDAVLIGTNSEIKELARLFVKKQSTEHTRQGQGWRKSFLADFFDHNIEI